ncbi:MAG TPA: hypothetical protein DIW17_16710 [Clostridiales bacterium]|nr:hypothetical protein [Clostridiales bacterium]
MEIYKCKKTVKPIVIDGNLNKHEWEQAQKVSLVGTVIGEIPKQKSWAKLLWDEENLYAAFYCEDDYINAKMTNYNDPIYDEEVVEIFLDDDSDQKTYIEIELSPLNTLLHYFIYNNLDGKIITFAKVKKTTKCAIYDNREENYWTAEMAVPMSEFVTAPNNPPQPGDKWRMNLYRIDRPEDGSDEHSAWQPTGEIQFHKPEKFGTLEFT